MIAIHSLLHMKAKRHCTVAVKLPVQLPVTDDKEIIIFVSYCGYLNEKEKKIKRLYQCVKFLTRGWG